MKRLLNSKKFIQKMLIAIIIALLLSFAVPVKSQAGWGGMLLDPLFDLVGTLIDVVTGALQMFLVDGQMNNSGDASGFNFFLVDVKYFLQNVDGEYKEFKYDGRPEDATQKINKSDLDMNEITNNSTFAIPVLKYTPEKIFSGQIPALDINFVKPTDWATERDEDGNLIYNNGSEMNKRSVAQALHQTIASWYVGLRNLSIVGLMLVLVYVGIRIIISSTASDKSKYKQMLLDWLIALCLLFCMHYIMTFTTTVVTEISRAISGTNESNNGNNISVVVVEDDTNTPVTEDGKPLQFRTDLMGLMRFKMQSPTILLKLLYLILYIAMVVYTVKFTIYYLKRVLTMAFLTLISPLVALTYPIDKLRDGKAQAFDMWFKEYIFNALVQPFHLIIYTIFVSSAIDLAAENPLFAIVALAFLTPAENILRKFFGFEKSTTSGSLKTMASMAGGAAAMNMAKKALSGGGGKSSPKGKNDVRTIKPPERDISGWVEATGTPTNTEDSISNNESGRINITARDNIFSGGSTLIGPTNKVSQTNTSQNDIPSALTDHRDYKLNSSGLYVPEDDARKTQTQAQAEPEPDNPSEGSIRTADKPWEWKENDDRGLGQYLGEIGGYFAGKAGNRVKETKFGRKVGSGVNTVRDLAKNGKNKLDSGIKHIPKPIRNTARGVLKVGKEAGMGALRVAGRAAAAAPGAIFGMGAGIAGDELGDIAKYTAAGAALTGATLPGVGSSIASVGSGIRNVYREGVSGSDDAAIAQVERDFVKSKENDAVINHEFKHDGKDLSRTELKARKQQIAHYIGQGFDVDASIKAAKTEDKIRKELHKQQEVPENADELAQAQASRIMKVAKDYSAKDLRDDNKVNGLRNQIADSLIKGNFGKKEAEDQAARYVQYIKEAKGVK